jgi:hypothetical protein
MGVLTPTTVILAVGVDLTYLKSQSLKWDTAGYFIIFASTVREAIDHFRFGDFDFDLVLIGESIPDSSRERLTFIMRASGPRVPVVCVTDTPEDCESYSDATLKSSQQELLTGIAQLSARLDPRHAPRAVFCGNVH